MEKFTTMVYDPYLTDANAFRTTPGSEAEARAQFQNMFDQVTAYINGTLIPQLESANTGSSGADKIGSAAINGLDTGGANPVSPITVRDQIALIQHNFDTAVKGKITVAEAMENGSLSGLKLIDGTVAGAKLENGAVTADKLAGGIISATILSPGSLTTDKLQDLSVTNEKIATGAVIEGKIGSNAVTNTKIKDGEVYTSKLADLAVSNGKLAANAVTTAKIADGNVTTAKIADGNVTAAKIASATITGGNIAQGTITLNNLAAEVQTKLADNRTRNITISSNDPSGGIDGDIWLKTIS